jgi:hypothetical protein
MKKQILSFSFAVFGLTAMQGNASAQDHDRRVDAARAAVDEGRAYRPDQDHWNRGDGERRAAYELDRLNREVRAVRLEIGDSRRAGQRIRDRFHRVKRATDNLNYQFRSGNLRHWEVRRRTDEIRGDLQRIRRELRNRP